MPWDGRDRRKSDESNVAILAEIRTDIKYLIAGAELVKIQLHEHEKDDSHKFEKIESKFTGIDKTIWKAGGAVSAVVLILTLLSNIWHR